MPSKQAFASGILFTSVTGTVSAVLVLVFASSAFSQAVVPATLLNITTCGTVSSGLFQFDQLDPYPRVIEVSFPGALCQDDSVWPPAYDCCARFIGVHDRFWAAVYADHIGIHLDGYQKALDQLLEKRTIIILFASMAGILYAGAIACTVGFCVKNRQARQSCVI